MPKRSRADDGDDETHTRGYDKATWTRIMNRRQQDVNELNLQRVVSILTRVPKAPNSTISAEGTSPRDQLEELLWDHMEIAGDSTQSATQRRQSLDAILQIKSEIDKELKRPVTHPQPTAAPAGRSVFDRVDLSATNSTVPAGSNSTNPQNATPDVAPGTVPVHPAMRKSGASTISPTTVTTPLSTTTTAPVHPAYLGRQSSTSSVPAVSQGTSSGSSATTTTGASGVSTTSTTTRRPSGTNSTTAPVVNSTTTGGSAPIIHPSMRKKTNQGGNVNAATTSNTTTSTAPVHPSMQRNSSSATSSTLADAAGALNAAVARTNTTATITTSVNSTVPIHPSMQRNSSSAGTTTGTAQTSSTRTTGSTVNTSTANSSVPVHPSMQRNSSSTGGTATATTNAVGNLPVHPSMQNKTSSSAVTATTGTSAATNTAAVSNAGSLPVHPSMQNKTSSSAVTATTGTSAATNAPAASNAGNLPVHPSMQNKTSSSAGTTGAGTSVATNAAAVSNAGNLPVHPSMQNKTSSSAGTTATRTSAATNAAAVSNAGNLPVHPSMQNKTSSSAGTAATGNLPVHPSVQGNSSSAGTTRAASTTTTASGTAAGNLPVHPSMQGNSSTTGQKNTTVNKEGTSSSNQNDKSQKAATATTNSNRGASTAPGTANRDPIASSSSNGQSSAISQTSAATTAANPSVSGKTSRSNQSSTAAQTSTATTAANPSVSGQTSRSNQSSTAAQTSTATTAANPSVSGQTETSTSQGGSSASGPNPPQPDASRPEGQSPPNRGSTGTATSVNASRNQPATASGQSTTSTTPANTAKANGNTVTNSTTAGAAATIAASIAPKNGQNGTIPSDTGETAKENRKPTVKPRRKPILQEDAGPKEVVYSDKPTVLSFPADPGDGGRTGCVVPRPPCTVNFYRVTQIPYADIKAKGNRFSCTEPYWAIEKVIVNGMTSKVDKVDWKAGVYGSTNKPNTVWRHILTEKTMKNFARAVKKWGEHSDEPQEGENRILLRMLPVKFSEKLKKKRAECHLWPKGTMLLVNGEPQDVAQRKQQSHDKSEWKQMCKHFDLSSVISFPLTKQTIQLCCVDDEQYHVSIALCQYRTPQFLFRKLLGKEPECKTPPLSHALERLSLEESMNKAKERINQSAIVLDDDTGNKASKNDARVGKFVFSLVDPLNKQPISTPVRGKKCKHWQCFDLENFLKMNLPVSGSRWRCPCCEQFLDHNELQFCALTQAALDKFRDQVTPTRGRVEFRLDETYELLPEDKLRYSKAKHETNGNVSTKEAPGEPKPRPVQKEIEIIEIDDSD